MYTISTLLQNERKEILENQVDTVPAFSSDTRVGNTLFNGLQMRRKVNAQPSTIQREYCSTI